MAGGKTFHGLGEIESAFRDDASDGEDVRGVYSGPTVVDDDKVEEGLKKLRSLDQPPGPLTGVTEVVVDSSSSAKTKIAELPTQGRPTAVGHSLGTPQVGQTISSDPLRGTMFGHSIHLPDVNSPDDVAEELSSGALMVTEASAPHLLGPFPLADGATRPQGALGPLVPHAEPLRLAGDGLFPQAEPFRRPNKNFRIPEDTTDQLTAPRSKSAQRIALAFVAAGLAAVGFVVWQQVHEGGSDPEPAPPAAAADPAPAAEPATAAAPAAEGAPSPTAAATPSPSVAAQPPRVPDPAAKPAAAAPTPRQRSSSRTAAGATEEAKAPGPAVEEPAAAAAPAATEPAPTTATTATTAEEEAPPPAKSASRRRRGSRAGADDDQAAPSRPARSAKPKVEEDPDATLPPSLD